MLDAEGRRSLGRMFGLGMGELLVILVVALLVLGPKRLPEVASGLGKALRDFKRATQDIQAQLQVDETIAKPLAELQSALNDTPPPAPRTPPVVAPGAPPEGAIAQPRLGQPAALDSDAVTPPADEGAPAPVSVAAVAHKD